MHVHLHFASEQHAISIQKSHISNLRPREKVKVCSKPKKKAEKPSKPTKKAKVRRLTKKDVKRVCSELKEIDVDHAS